MAQYVPDQATAYEADLDNLIQALKGNSVLSGGAVAAQGAPNMTVQVAVGVARYAGLPLVIPSTASLAISAADPSNARIDLVVLSSGGAVSVSAGTPSATPKPPSMSSSAILLAYVSVPAAAVNIQSSNISDRRLTVGDGVLTGTTAARPAATGVPAGTTYLTTDDPLGPILVRSTGSSWEQVNAAPQPNLILNSDFSRRTVFGLAMPEVFADTSGYVVVSGAAPTVGSNIVTSTAANELAWCNQSFVWRDGRASATFKAKVVADRFSLFWRIDANNTIEVRQEAGAFNLYKTIAGTPTQVATTAFGLTINNWYWLEIEKQGTTIIVKLYNTGGTAPGVTKASSTLGATLTGTVADAAVQVGAHISVYCSTATAQWGGIATGNGGVYVETWLPESWQVGFTGTLGGQAWGMDETADAGGASGAVGPLGKQFVPRFYSPATSRGFQGGFGIDSTFGTNYKVAQISPSAAYNFSAYVKTSGASGNGVSLVATDLDTVPSQFSNVVLITAGTVGAPTAWTRFSGSGTSNANGRYIQAKFTITGVSGTFWVDLFQIEQGSAATAWRNAPADDSPIVWSIERLGTLADVTITAASATEVDPRDAAGNFFIPWDARLDIGYDIGTKHGTAQGYGVWTPSVDGSGLHAAYAAGVFRHSLANNLEWHSLKDTTTVAAGKHRIAARLHTAAGTLTVSGDSTAHQGRLQVIATRGK